MSWPTRAKKASLSSARVPSGLAGLGKGQDQVDVGRKLGSPPPSLPRPSTTRRCAAPGRRAARRGAREGCLGPAQRRLQAGLGQGAGARQRVLHLVQTVHVAPDRAQRLAPAETAQLRRLLGLDAFARVQLVGARVSAGRGSLISASACGASSYGSRWKESKAKSLIASAAHVPGHAGIVVERHTGGAAAFQQLAKTDSTRSRRGRTGRAAVMPAGLSPRPARRWCLQRRAGPKNRRSALRRASSNQPVAGLADIVVRPARRSRRDATGPSDSCRGGIWACRRRLSGAARRRPNIVPSRTSGRPQRNPHDRQRRPAPVAPAAGRNDLLRRLVDGLDTPALHWLSATRRPWRRSRRRRRTRRPQAPPHAA